MIGRTLRLRFACPFYEKSGETIVYMNKEDLEYFQAEGCLFRYATLPIDGLLIQGIQYTI